MSAEEFKSIISSVEPETIVMECLYRDYIHAIPSAAAYRSYLDIIVADYPRAEHIAIMGSGNWCFSLNPEKEFRPFCEESDIDIVIVCRDSFEKTWDELRLYHRKNYYLMSSRDREKLKRNGENVYSGFITPKWISNKRSPLRFNFEINANKYSNEYVQYRKVNMMYFKNITETVDYYVRGFRLARNS